ncbi:MAG: hypothetical protein JWO00_445, partial [Candidatus Parcubacteria bacterium]|nr:hypothetical protein [Candidatus Parcubacteria bacterium]
LLRQPGIAHKIFFSSLSLGIALLMKPQAIPTLLALGILGIILFASRDRDWKKVLILFSLPATLLIVFSAYFGFALHMQGHKTLSSISERVERLGASRPLSDFIAGSTFLPAHYAHVPDIMPAVNANMPGPWFFVAESIRVEDQPIYRVSDKLSFAGIRFRTWGLALFLAAAFFFAYRIGRSGRTAEQKIALVMVIVPILVPYLTTSAHESHFYLGFAMALILAAWLSDRRALWAACILGVLNGLNLLCLYILPRYGHIAYAPAAQASITAASTIVFSALAWLLVRAFTRPMPLPLRYE